MVSDSIPHKLFWMRVYYKPRSSLCTHAFHCMDSNDLTFMSWTGECWQQKHTQHAASTTTESHYLKGWIKKNITYTKISPKMVNPRALAGECRRSKPHRYAHPKRNVLFCVSPSITSINTWELCTHIYLINQSNKMSSGDVPPDLSLSQHFVTLYPISVAALQFLWASPTAYCLVGLVVKVSALRAEDPRFESCLRQDFLGVQVIPAASLMATLPGAWHHRVSTGTGQPGVSIL